MVSQTEKDRRHDLAVPAPFAETLWCIAGNPSADWKLSQLLSEQLVDADGNAEAKGMLMTFKINC